jgi:hypothetical protein
MFDKGIIEMLAMRKVERESQQHVVGGKTKLMRRKNEK